MSPLNPGRIMPGTRDKAMPKRGEKVKRGGRPLREKAQNARRVGRGGRAQRRCGGGNGGGRRARASSRTRS